MCDQRQIYCCLCVCAKRMFIVDRILNKYTNCNQVFSKHFRALRFTVPATLTMTTLTLRMTPTRAKALTLSTIVSIQCTHTHTPHTPHTPHTHRTHHTHIPHTHTLWERASHVLLSQLPHNAALSALSRARLCKPNRRSITHTTWWPPNKALLHKVASGRQGKGREGNKTAGQRFKRLSADRRRSDVTNERRQTMFTTGRNKIENKQQQQQ